jgi:hypothetical protein
MASNINPNNIDITYPIAGQDNDTQGFRTNFTNIRNNFNVASSEITAAQAKLNTITKDATVFLPAVPPTQTAAGTKGQMAFDDNQFYYCYDTNKWRRMDSFGWTDQNLTLHYGDINVAAYLSSTITSNIGNVFVDPTISNISTRISSVTTQLGLFETWANLNYAQSGGPSTTSLANDITNLSSNVAAYKTWANAAISSLSSNIIATTVSASTSTNANLTAYKTWANANVAGLANSISTVNANLTSFSTYANATFSTSTYGDGSVTRLLATFTGNVAAGNVLTNSLIYANGAPYSFGSTYSNANVALYLPAYNGNIATSNLTVSASFIPSSNAAAVNIGSVTNWFNNIYGKAVSAKYADLAENYVADDVYAPGTVVVFGGDAEITVSTVSHDTRVAGVVSTDPAYLMNSDTAGLPVALTGRAPCFVQGPVAKGDRLVNISAGVAGLLDEKKYKPGCIIGKSLHDITDDRVQLIEIAVGRY